MKFILGKKIGMTQVFLDNGTVVPVTRIQAGPCLVTQVKTKEKDGVDALQIGFGKQKVFRLSQAVRGHLKDIMIEPGITVRYVRDARLDEPAELKRGSQFTVNIFSPGEKVQVVGTSKGKGFQGVVKRHGFAGGPASHGHKDNLRMPGSIGAGGVQRVFKNMRMGGHMGADQVTVKNLEVIKVEPEAHEIFIKGAIPGARHSLVIISTPEGTIEVETQNTVSAESAPVNEPEKTDHNEASPVVNEHV